jgi:hypothetical protein
MHSILPRLLRPQLAANAAESAGQRRLQEEIVWFRESSSSSFRGEHGALSTVAVAAPFVRGAYAAGKLSVGFWDHWVPDANGAPRS